MHGLTAGNIAVGGLGLQWGVLEVTAVGVLGRERLERKPVHGGEGAGGSTGVVEGSVLGEEVVVGEGRGLGRMEEH